MLNATENKIEITCPYCEKTGNYNTHNYCIYCGKSLKNLQRDIQSE